MSDPRPALILLLLLSSVACQNPAAASVEANKKFVGAYAWTADGQIMRVNVERSADDTQVYAEIEIQREGGCQAYRETLGGEALDNLRDSWVIVNATSHPRPCRSLDTPAPTAVDAADLASVVKATRVELLDTYILDGEGLGRHSEVSPLLNLGTRTALLVNASTRDGVAKELGALYDLEANTFAGVALRADWVKEGTRPPTVEAAYRVRLIHRDSRDAELLGTHDRLRCSFFTSLRKRNAEDARANRITPKDAEDQLLREALENHTEVCQ